MSVNILSSGEMAKVKQSIRAGSTVEVTAAQRSAFDKKIK